METYINAQGNPRSKEIAQKMAEAILSGKIAQVAAWEATTNIEACGGMDKPCRAIIHRALRKMGYVFFLSMYEGTRTDESNGEDYNYTLHQWGIVHKTQLKEMQQDPELVALVQGYTLCHAAHKLGFGNATEGWKFFHSF